MIQSNKENINKANEFLKIFPHLEIILLSRKNVIEYLTRKY